MRGLLFFFIVVFTGCSIAQRNGAKTVSTSDDFTINTDYNYHFTEGTKFKLLNNTNQAINLFFKCIELKPKNPAPYYQLSEIYFIKGDLARALAFSKKSVALDAKNTWYLMQLARIYLEKGSIDSTILTYIKIVKLKPTGYDENFNLALLYIQNNEPKKALHILKDLKIRHGNNDQLVLNLFRVYSNLKDHRNIIRVLHEATLQFPDDIRFPGLLAEYYVSMADYINALKYYNILLAIDPDNEKTLISLIEYYRIVKDYSKLCSYSSRYIADSTFSYKNKIEIVANMIADANFLMESSASVLYLIQRMDSLYHSDFRINTLYTDFYLKTKNYPLAEEKLTYLVSNYQTTIAFWEQFIFVLSSQNKHKLIIDYCDKAINQYGKKPFFFLYKGIALYQLKQYKEAISVLNEGLGHSKGSDDLKVQFYTFLGESHNYIANFAASDTFFRQALKLDPYNLFILNNYSYYLAQRADNLELASKYILICLERHPNSYSYLDTYGWILYKMGKYENARKVFEEALKNGGNIDIEVLEHYVIVLHTLGLIETANRYFQKVKELGEPSNELKILFNK